MQLVNEHLEKAKQQRLQNEKAHGVDCMTAELLKTEMELDFNK